METKIILTKYNNADNIIILKSYKNEYKGIRMSLLFNVGILNGRFAFLFLLNNFSEISLHQQYIYCNTFFF